MADPVASLLQSERIRQALRDGQVDNYSAIADKWRSYTYSARVESAPAAATSVTTPPPSRASPSVSRIHDKMAVATAPSIGFFLPTPQPVPSTIVISGPGLPAVTSLAAGVRIPSSRPTTIATVVRAVSTGANQFLTTPKPIPRYSGAGNLLTASCTTAEYTFVDAGSSLYYVPFIGCINNKPDCCPFIPRPTGSAIYPQPTNREGAVLDHCPADYHSVSGGGCCPSGYTRWTSLLGGQTPCFSSFQARRTPQATATHPGRGISTAGKPTVVIADAVFAMQYTTEQASGAISGGAIAGIVIGVIAAVIFSAGLAYVFIRRRRAMNPGIDLKSENGGGSSYRGTPAPPEISGSNMSASNTQTREVTSVGRCTGQGFDAPPSYEAPSAERLRDQEPLRVHVSRSSSREEDLSQKPTPGDEEDLDDGYTFESEASSPIHENTGILEVQLARPQRLSRGYARIVYTQQAQGSVSSIHTDGKSIRSNLTEPR